jgi:hypothetical protein
MRLNITNTTAKKLARKKIIPPDRPLFSNTVPSAKYERTEGIPKPNEKPNQNEMRIRPSKELTAIARGNNDATMPKPIHVNSKTRLFILNEIRELQKLERTIAK